MHIIASAAGHTSSSCAFTPSVGQLLDLGLALQLSPPHVGAENDVHLGHLAIRNIIECMMRWLRYHITNKTRRALGLQIAER